VEGLRLAGQRASDTVSGEITKLKDYKIGKRQQNNNRMGMKNTESDAFGGISISVAVCDREPRPCERTQSKELSGEMRKDSVNFHLASETRTEIRGQRRAVVEKRGNRLWKGRTLRKEQGHFSAGDHAHFQNFYRNQKSCVYFCQ